MKHTSTFFLRMVITLSGLGVLSICLFLFPNWISSDNTGNYRPILAGMYITTIPFFIALYHMLQLLKYVDANTAFSWVSVQALKYIKYCTLSIGMLYALGMPYIFSVAQQDDAPGVVLIGLIFTCAPLTISVFAALFQKLLQDALRLKSENDLAV